MDPSVTTSNEKKEHGSHFHPSAIGFMLTTTSPPALMNGFGTYRQCNNNKQRSESPVPLWLYPRCRRTISIPRRQGAATAMDGLVFRRNVLFHRVRHRAASGDIETDKFLLYSGRLFMYRRFLALHHHHGQTNVPSRLAPGCVGRLLFARLPVVDGGPFLSLAKVNRGFLRKNVYEAYHSLWRTAIGSAREPHWRAAPCWSPTWR
jgi:hypothetical protein